SPRYPARTPSEAAMRSFLLVPICALVVGLSAYRADGPREVRLRLLDATTGEDVAGIVRVFEKGKDAPLPLPGLFDRWRGLKPAPSVAGWSVVPKGGAKTPLPRAVLRVEALSGLESALVRREVDLGKEAPAEISLRPPLLFRPEDEKLVAANTHLHLR